MPKRKSKDNSRAIPAEPEVYGDPSPLYSSPPPRSPNQSIDIMAPPANPALAIAMHFAEPPSERSTAELLCALPHLKRASRTQVGNVIWSLPRLLDAARHSQYPVGRKHL